MEKNPFREVVNSVKVLIHRYEPGSEDDKNLKRFGIPIRCQCCGTEHTDEEPVEMAEVITIVEQKILLPDKGLTDDFLTNPFMVIYCKNCFLGVFAEKTPELPFYQ